MDLLEKVREAGVTGAGGAGFPTHVKLNTKAEYLLMNGAECEPLLCVDQQLMEKFPQEILQGFLVAKEITGARKAIIGIKGKHQKVIEILREAIRQMGMEENIEIGILPDIYPAGDEQVLVYELTGRIVPETGLPISVGCVVINVETTYNIYHAVNDEPVTMKYVTVSGDVPAPVTVKVPVGAPLIEVIRLAGKKDFSDCEFVEGGPMMGTLIQNRNTYVTKKTKGLIVLPADHSLVQKKKRSMQGAIRINRSACEQCSMCTDICPRHLLGHSTSPHKMVRAMAYRMEADERMKVALTCCQCNLCEYFSCPAGISPKMANVYYMSQLKRKKIRHIPKGEFQVSAMREYRKIPSQRLIARLNLSGYQVVAPLSEELFLEPELVGIYLNDHVGTPATALVQVGEYVNKGQKIADVPEGTMGAVKHASIAGTVEAIEDHIIMIRRD